MAEQGRKAVTQMAGLSEQIARIEAKLDALLEGLADEEAQDDAVEIVTMDGQKMTVTAGSDWL